MSNYRTYEVLVLEDYEDGLRVEVEFDIDPPDYGVGIMHPEFSHLDIVDSEPRKAELLEQMTDVEWDRAAGQIMEKLERDSQPEY